MDLRLPRLRGLLRGPRRLGAAAAVVVVLAGAGTWTAVADDAPAPVHRADRVMSLDGVRIDTSYFTSGGTGRRPAVLLAHGFGGSKADVRQQAEGLARDGYAVLTWSSRSFGKSTGRIGLNDPKGEVAAPAVRGRAVLHAPGRDGPRPARPGGPCPGDHRLRRHARWWARPHRWRSPSSRRSPPLPGVASAVRTDEGLLVRLDADGSARRLVTELVRLEVPVESVGPHRRLEDAFLTLIGESA
ncbi:hypothetical protein SALBM311S_03829 [Streptomyces alboniger]